jgi:hypothetical protein
VHFGLERVAPGDFVFVDQLFLDGLHAEFHRRQDLDDTIVQIGGHAAAFGFLGFADGAGKPRRASSASLRRVMSRRR